MSDLMDNVTDTYPQWYQKDSVTEKMIAAYDCIADEFVKMFRPRSHCDVGCGAGPLLQGMAARGVTTVGIEGSAAALEFKAPTSTIIVHDLRIPFRKEQLGLPWGGADLVTCFDVGEHIAEEHHEVFCDTIRACMAPGGALIFGAAGEGQDGYEHVACRHVCYWIDRFQARGLKLLAGNSEVLRMAIHKRPEAAHAWWTNKNQIVMRENFFK